MERARAILVCTPTSQRASLHPTLAAHTSASFNPIQAKQVLIPIKLYRVPVRLTVAWLTLCDVLQGGTVLYCTVLHHTYGTVYPHQTPSSQLRSPSISHSLLCASYSNFTQSKTTLHLPLCDSVWQCALLFISAFPFLFWCLEDTDSRRTPSTSSNPVHVDSMFDFQFCFCTHHRSVRAGIVGGVIFLVSPIVRLARPFNNRNPHHTRGGGDRR